MADRTNILVGPAEVFVDGVSVGWTEGGVEIEKSVDIFEKEVDQHFDALDIVATKWTLTVRTAFAEATLENLKIAWNETSTIQAGPPKRLGIGLQQEIPEHQLEFVGPGPNGTNRRYRFWRAKLVGSSGHAYKKDDKVIFPVEFRILPDETRTEDERYGEVLDEQP